MKENQIIQNLIADGENEQLGFKSDVLKDSIAKIICSFLNSKGGTVLIGIDDKKNIVGVKNADKLKADLENYLVAAIVPEAPVTVSIEKINGKKLLLLKVWGGSKQPYIFNGSIYYRRGNITQKATSKEISDLIHNRSISEKNWERQVFTEVSLEDLDSKLIIETIKESHKNNKTNFTGDDILKFLIHYGLYENGAFTKACVVLFAKNPVRFLPQIRVRLTEYPESKTDKALIRDKYFEGNLFRIREDIEKYINGLGTRSVFDKNQWKRIDFSFPKKALQEGVINALIHRDYSSSTSGVAISVYPDTFVISNSGKFPDDIQIKDLKRNHRSHPVNPDIAHIVYLRGFIDKLGRGTVKLVEECRSAGLKEPVWKETSEGVTLTFHGPKALSERKQQNE
ncbi:MAG TPA: putative DNA binding domain-containing protein, partial [Clostridiales bacterium]|nr:putative DNA binding domain-containing protein [Clostridiales bacterium]HQP69293.1 putative DNA binding domain-containing protein [Clostridiales bacterium]